MTLKPVPADNARAMVWVYYYTILVMMILLTGAMMVWFPPLSVIYPAFSIYLMKRLTTYTFEGIRAHEGHH